MGEDELRSEFLALPSFHPHSSWYAEDKMLTTQENYQASRTEEVAMQVRVRGDR